MTTLEQIEKLILHLSREELARLRDWLDELEGHLLDALIERAAAAGGQGRLSQLAAEALADQQAGGRCKLR
jgi:hypothetical protein